jgi:hypothetical protein
LKINNNSKKKEKNGENKEKKIFTIQDLQTKVVGIAILKDILFIGVLISCIEFIYLKRLNFIYII